jgi:Cd2+/Zn2+-exporting ATPase
MPHDSHDHAHDHALKHDHAHEDKPAHSHGGCCSHSHAAGASAPALPSAPIDGASTAKYRIANMDCPTEERLIRNKLANMAGVVGLDFNLMNRVLDVHHTLPTLATVEAALHGIGMQAIPMAADAVVARNPDEGSLGPMHKGLLVVSGLDHA